ncbi:hypothetical protein [Acinetobacter johnsonii]|uniref:hypothetical protein n=1 Tax=Acinetobacter johnsonii TaxID=40214 RepID=UPI00244A414B|nr:hypothetical protein [Acinetobacter johnsonii]MDH0711327.1 hypothetical protein [Acinetobacter johnsonii]
MTLDDVMSFISEADESDLESIAEELTDRGVDFHCSECEDHECECDCDDEDSDHEKNEFIRHLINRANQFGLQDLLNELKYEGDRVGAYLNIKGGAL